MSDASLRFGYQLSAADDTDPVGSALRAEQLGFDVVSISDHVGAGAMPSPIPTLAAIAQATAEIRIGTLVLNNEMRNPVQLAWEATTLDRLSDGRLELGIGAGHTPHEWQATGIPMEPAAVRKTRLMESVELIRMLVDGDVVNHDGGHYQVSQAQVDRSVQDRLPILVGGNGERLLNHAGKHADIVGLQGLAKTQPDGHRHSVRWTTEHLDNQINQVKAGAAGRPRLPELSALVQVVEITDSRQAALEVWAERTNTDLENLASMPYVMIGTIDEIVEHIHQCRARWGITYFTVRDPAFAAVVEVLS